MQIFTWLYHTRQNCTRKKAWRQKTCLHGHISLAGKPSFNSAHKDVWFSLQVTDKTYTSLVLACVVKALGTHGNNKTVYTNYLYIHIHVHIHNLHGLGSAENVWRTNKENIRNIFGFHFKSKMMLHRIARLGTHAERSWKQEAARLQF